MHDQLASSTPNQGSPYPNQCLSGLRPNVSDREAGISSICNRFSLRSSKRLTVCILNSYGREWGPGPQ